MPRSSSAPISSSRKATQPSMRRTSRRLASCIRRPTPSNRPTTSLGTSASRRWSSASIAMQRSTWPRPSALRLPINRRSASRASCRSWRRRRKRSRPCSSRRPLAPRSSSMVGRSEPRPSNTSCSSRLGAAGSKRESESGQGSRSRISRRARPRGLRSKCPGPRTSAANLTPSCRPRDDQAGPAGSWAALASLRLESAPRSSAWVRPRSAAPKT